MILQNVIMSHVMNMANHFTLSQKMQQKNRNDIKTIAIQILKITVVFNDTFIYANNNFAIFIPSYPALYCNSRCVFTLGKSFRVNAIILMV